jgi:hypothetical protein
MSDKGKIKKPAPPKNSDEAALRALKEVEAEDNSRPTLQSFIILETLKWLPFVIFSLLMLGFFISWLRG